MCLGWVLELGSWMQRRTLVRTLTCCVILGKWLVLSEAQFLHVRKGDCQNAYLPG